MNQLAANPKVVCFVVAIDLPADEDYAREPLNLKVSPTSHPSATDMSNTIILKWSDEVDMMCHEVNVDTFLGESDGFALTCFNEPFHSINSLNLIQRVETGLVRYSGRV